MIVKSNGMAGDEELEGRDDAAGVLELLAAMGAPLSHEEEEEESAALEALKAHVGLGATTTTAEPDHLVAPIVEESLAVFADAGDTSLRITGTGGRAIAGFRGSEPARLRLEQAGGEGDQGVATFSAHVLGRTIEARALGPDGPSAARRARNLVEVARDKLRLEMNALLQAAIKDVGTATGAVLGFAARAQDLCDALAEEYPHAALVAFQSVNLHECTVGTIAGSRIGKELIGLARHTLVQQRDLRDVQVDIALETAAELIQGRDARFDKHISASVTSRLKWRMFVPLVVLRDRAGRVAHPGPGRECRWQRDEVANTGSTRARLRAVAPRGYQVESFGTIEVSFEERPHLTDDYLERLVVRVQREAMALYRSTLQHMLEIIGERATALGGTPSSSLQLLRQSSRGQYYSYVVPVGIAAKHAAGRSADGGINSPPRQDDGLGIRALRRGEPMVLAGEELARFNPRLYGQGVRAAAAFPLLVHGSDEGTARRLREGVLYLHRFVDDRLDGETIQLVWQFLEVACRDIARVIDDGERRDRARRLAALRRPDTLGAGTGGVRSARGRLMGTAQNVLAADVVILASSKDLADASSWAVAGRLADWRGLSDASLLLAAKEAFYEDDVAGGRLPARRFTDREGLRSLAVIPIGSGEARACLLLGYRVGRAFSSVDRELIEQFAQATAALLSGQSLDGPWEELVRAAAKDARAQVWS